MKIERVKELVEQVKRHVPEGGKFSVYGHAALVLEGTATECEFVAFVVDTPTHFHMRKIYGDMESRLEGEWVGNNEVRIYTGYLEARVKMVGDIPCRHEAHPDLDLDVLSVPLILTGKNVDFADVCGDILGLGGLVDDMMESRSASKALLQNPISLKDTPHGEPQSWKRGVFRTSEYRGRLVQCSEDQLKMTDDLENNRRRYNSASLKLKVTYNRRLAAWARAIGNESLTAQCDTSGGWLSRRTQVTLKDEKGNLMGGHGEHKEGDA